MNLSASLTALDLTPTVTTTSTIPEPAGLVAVQAVVLLQETFAAGFAPKLTEVPDVLKFVPLMVTTVPPAVVPEVGLSPVTVGTGAGRTMHSNPAVPPLAQVLGNTRNKPHMPA